MSKNYNKMYKEDRVPERKHDGLSSIVSVADEVHLGIDLGSQPDETVITPPAPQEPMVGKIVNSKKVNFRKSPEATSEVLSILDINDEVLILDMYNNEPNADQWTRVDNKGVIGYVMSKYIQI